MNTPPPTDKTMPAPSQTLSKWTIPQTVDGKTIQVEVSQDDFNAYIEHLKAEGRIEVKPVVPLPSPVTTPTPSATTS